MEEEIFINDTYTFSLSLYLDVSEWIDEEDEKKALKLCENGDKIGQFSKYNSNKNWKSIIKT